MDPDEVLAILNTSIVFDTVILKKLLYCMSIKILYPSVKFLAVSDKQAFGIVNV